MEVQQPFNLRQKPNLKQVILIKNGEVEKNRFEGCGDILTKKGTESLKVTAKKIAPLVGDLKTEVYSCKMQSAVLSARVIKNSLGLFSYVSSRTYGLQEVIDTIINLPDDIEVLIFVTHQDEEAIQSFLFNLAKELDTLLNVNIARDQLSWPPMCGQAIQITISHYAINTTLSAVLL